MVAPDGGDDKLFEDQNNCDLYTPCPFCLGFVLMRELERHCRSCPHQPQSNKSLDHPNFYLQSTCLLTGMEMDHAVLKESILSHMKTDEVYRKILGDELILQLGEYFVIKVGTSKRAYVSGKLREVGRLKKELDEAFGPTVHGMQDYIDPSKFDALIVTIQRMCRFDNDTERDIATEVGIPSLALKLGHTLKKLAYICRGKAIRAKNWLYQKSVAAFLNLMEDEFGPKVSSHALTSLFDKKSESGDSLVPLSSDIAKLICYLDQKLENLE